MDLDNLTNSTSLQQMDWSEDSAAYSMEIKDSILTNVDNHTRNGHIPGASIESIDHSDMVSGDLPSDSGEGSLFPSIFAPIAHAPTVIKLKRISSGHHDTPQQQALGVLDTHYLAREHGQVKSGRKRGRPRKIRTEVDGVKKRGRGRPRKYKPEDENSSQTKQQGTQHIHIMDSEILWDILKSQTESQVQQALPDSSQVKPLSQVKPV